MSARTEFPDYPFDTMPAIPAAWQDISWGSDACPSYQVGSGMIVFVDFPDAKDREFSETKRFSVMADPEIAGHNDIELNTDDWNEILAFIAGRQP